ncbi:MAG: pyrroline-5-carboxylate reductase [Patescibacteria group bacterium]
MKIGIIGCGHMGSALAKAILANGIGEVMASQHHKPQLALKKSEQKNFEWTGDNRQVVKKSDVVILGVKPNMIQVVLREVQNDIDPKQILISIAAATPLARLTLWSGGHKKIVRTMPNLAALVGESMTVWKTSPSFPKKEKAAVKKLLESFGKALEVQDEKLIDVISTVAGCGPAYVAAFLESMEKMLLQYKISSQDARTLAIQTIVGTADYFTATGTPFATLKNAVQTKGGTTKAAFKVLNKKKWQQIFEDAMAAAYTRTQEMMGK